MDARVSLHLGLCAWRLTCDKSSSASSMTTVRVTYAHTYVLHVNSREDLERSAEAVVEGSAEVWSLLGRRA